MDEYAATDGGQGCFFEVKGSLEELPGRYPWIDERLAKEIECELGLG